MNRAGATVTSQAVSDRPKTSMATLARIGLVLGLAALVIGSVHFARYDWTGIPLDRGPVTSTRTISPACHETIQPYTTESGRVISRSSSTSSSTWRWSSTTGASPSRTSR